MWKLERECRLFSSPQSKPCIPPTCSSTTDLREELFTAKEELAELKRQIQHIAKSPLTSPTFPHHSRQSSAEHHHHHYYYHLPEYSRELPPTTAAPAKIQDTPIHNKFFRELPTPPQTSSSTSSLSVRHERFNSSLSAWPQIDIESDPTDLPVDCRRKPSHDSLLNPTTPTIKRSASHESIFESKSTPPFRHLSSSPNQSTRSSPHSTSATSSPTYLSASAYLRQNNTSSLLLLSSARGKQFRGLKSRKSFWNLWDKSSPRPSRGVSSSLRNVSSSADLGRHIICTEVDVGMLQDALEG